MKIGIITFQMAWNCGAVLQCAALKKKLECMGHDVTVINYQPEYKAYRYCRYQNPITVGYKTWSSCSYLNNKKRLVKSAKSVVRAFLNWNPRSGRMKQKHDFEEFCRKYLNLSKRYSSIEELRANPPECDVYISGSDQLWNPNLTNGVLDPAYFLDFGENAIVRATYAISACELDIEAHKKQLKGFLEKIEYISLREAEKKAELEKLIGRKVYMTIDPTLLLEDKEYGFLEQIDERDMSSYILVYALDNPGTNDILFKSVRQISSERKLPVFVISGPHKWPYEVNFYKPQDGISPSEFLHYIKNADVVVTNSFHATTFSIVYKKSFYTIGTPGRSSRVVELLGKLDLDSRLLFCDKDGIIRIDTDNINYDAVKSRVEENRLESIEYLRKVIQQ